MWSHTRVFSWRVVLVRSEAPSTHPGAEQLGRLPVPERQRRRLFRSSTSRGLRSISKPKAWRSRAIWPRLWEFGGIQTVYAFCTGRAASPEGFPSLQAQTRPGQLRASKAQAPAFTAEVGSILKLPLQRKAAVSVTFFWPTAAWRGEFCLRSLRV